MEGSVTRKIVLLGKTGSGKSSLGNTIFEENHFPVNHSLSSGTKKCETKTQLVNEISISLIDTPGLFDTDMSEDDLKSEIVECIIECASGVHAFLIVFKWERFTEQEQAVMDKICSYFSDEVLKYAVVVFTHGDQLPEGKEIEEFVSQNKTVSDLVEKCGGRCHVIDNKYWNTHSGDEYRTNQFQVKELLNTINKMVTENEGRTYTNEFLEEVERTMQEEKEAIRRSSPSLSCEEIRNEAKKKVSSFLKYAAGITSGILLGALLGLPNMIAIVVDRLRETGIAADVLSVVASVGASTVGLGIVAGVSVVGGAVLGGYYGYCEAEKADSVGEAVKNTAVRVSQPCIKAVNNLKQKPRGEQEDEMCLLKKTD